MATVLDETVTTTALNLHRISFEVYERMVEQGLFSPNDPIELLDGLLVDKMTKGPQHRVAVVRAVEAVRVAMPAGWQIQSEQPVVLKDGPRGDSAPEPDLAVVFGDIERYAERLPVGGETGLVIEIASSPNALRTDRAWLGRYAHAGIPIACIINLPDRSIEVYREPSGPVASFGYKTSEILQPGQFLVGAIGTAITGPAELAPIPVGAFFARA